MIYLYPIISESERIHFSILIFILKLWIIILYLEIMIYKIIFEILLTFII